MKELTVVKLLLALVRLSALMLTLAVTVALCILVVRVAFAVTL